MIFRAFGLRVVSRFALPELTDALEADFENDNTGTDAVELTLGRAADVRGAFSGPATPPFRRDAVLGDGCTYTTTRGARGDYLLEYTPRAAFHISAGARTVLCATEDVDALAWQRFLLDTVLGTAALIRGYEGLHAGALHTQRGAVAIAATTGGGKSTLCAELVRRGYPLFTDDLVFLSHAGDTVVAHAGPPLMNLSSAMPGGLRAEQIGRVIGDVDGERWTAVTRPPVLSCGLAAVVILERQATTSIAEPTVETIPASPMPLLAHALEGNGDADRPRRRFELFSDLAASARIVHVRAHLTVSPAGLADAVVAAL